MEEVLIEFNSVSKVYQNKWKALDKINLQVYKNEFVFLIGHSGAGKTTFLKHVYFAEFPDEGEVNVLNFSSKSIKRKDIWKVRRKIGMIFQDFKLFEDRNVFENLAFVCEVAYGKVDRDKIMEVLNLVGLLHRYDAMVYELSTGEQQRVAIARALLKKPIIMLADEPTGNLDPETSEEILKLLLDINSMGTTVIVATHDWRLLEIARDKRVVKMEKGQIISDEINI